jgi:hypothetical protein
MDAAGNLFGLATSGGTVFEVPAGTDTILPVVGSYNFQSEYLPTGLTADPSGNLYGTSYIDDDDTGSLFEATGTGFVANDSAPTVLTRPASEAGLAGHRASFTAIAGGYPAPAIQWQQSTDGAKHFTNITGNPSATTQTLTVDGLTPSQSDTEYRALFTNSVGTTASRPATLTVASITPVSAAHASPSTVTGTSTTLTALGETSTGASGLSYGWSVIRAPAGAATPSFSANNSNAAHRVVATFHDAGSYVFRCTISDGNSDKTVTDVRVDVVQVATSLRIWPSDPTAGIDEYITFHADLYDQFGNRMAHQPPFEYYVDSGPGTIDNNGGDFSSSVAGSAVIEADYYSEYEGDFSATARVQVIAPR